MSNFTTCQLLTKNENLLNKTLLKLIHQTSIIKDFKNYTLCEHKLVCKDTC
jgi:hypothetical protein